ncbi:ROK family transcriptional regulator [Mucilaginibacter gynuensis]|uniref:ROK family transcriptional regulator n=1 Tax=Mucilaginibacter gynuensis TaxID=1302236 RepID=A0ABP8GUW7_9SPHI
MRVLSANFSLLNEYPQLVKLLSYHGSLSATELSNLLGKSIPYVNKLVSELLDAEIVERKGYATSSGGRKPVKFSLVADSFYIVSVAMSQYDMEYVVLDMKGNFVSEVKKHKIDIYTMHAKELADLINAFLYTVTIPVERVISVSISMPGFVSTERGMNLTYLPVTGSSLTSVLQEAIQIPVFIENDSTAIALGEKTFGTAIGQNDAMVLNLGWGIGLGMILDNKVFRGHSGLAGEFSHISLFNNGKICACGKRGCLETESSMRALTGKVRTELENGQKSSLMNYEEIDIDAIVTEALKGDMLSVRLISEAAYNIGRGLAMLIHIMNPSIILLSGRASVIGKLWLSPIQQAIYEHSIPQLANDTQLLISELNVKAQLLGGAVLVIENLGQPLKNKINEIEKN